MITLLWPVSVCSHQNQLLENASTVRGSFYQQHRCRSQGSRETQLSAPNIITFDESCISNFRSKSSGRLRLYVYKKIVTESLMPHVKHDHFVYKILIKLTETLLYLLVDYCHNASVLSWELIITVVSVMQYFTIQCSFSLFHYFLVH